MLLHDFTSAVMSEDLFRRGGRIVDKSRKRNSRFEQTADPRFAENRKDAGGRPCAVFLNQRSQKQCAQH